MQADEGYRIQRNHFLPAGHPVRPWPALLTKAVHSFKAAGEKRQACRSVNGSDPILHLKRNV
jgi:hypothetical protein